MPNADHRGVGQLRAQQAVEAGFRSFIHRGRGFVHEQPVGFLQQGARECDALLFAIGKPGRPVLFFAEPVDQLRQVAVDERLGSGLRLSHPLGLQPLVG